VIPAPKRVIHDADKRIRLAHVAPSSEPSDRIQQSIVAEGLEQVIHGPAPQNLDRSSSFSMSSDEDDRHARVAADRRSVQLEPAHPRHAHIEDQQSVSRRRSESRTPRLTANTSTRNVTDLSRPRRDSRGSSYDDRNESCLRTGPFAQAPIIVFSEQDQLHLRIVAARSMRNLSRRSPASRPFGPGLPASLRASCASLAPVDLHGDFAGARFCGDLLVE